MTSEGYRSRGDRASGLGISCAFFFRFLGRGVRFPFPWSPVFGVNSIGSLDSGDISKVFPCSTTFMKSPPPQRLISAKGECLAVFLGKFLQTPRCFLLFRNKQPCLESYQSSTWPLKSCFSIQCQETSPFSSPLHTMPRLSPFSSLLRSLALSFYLGSSLGFAILYGNNDSLRKSVTSLEKSTFLLDHTQASTLSSSRTPPIS